MESTKHITKASRLELQENFKYHKEKLRIESQPHMTKNHQDKKFEDTHERN